MPKNKTTLESQAVTTHAPAIPVTGCRVCGNEALTDVLSLGEQFVSDFVTDDSVQGASAPLDLILCDASQGGCGLLQLRHTVDQQSMYRNYWYRSGVNQTMKLALADIVQKATAMVPLAAGDVVIDTGSNDNTLLKSYNRQDIT